MLAALAAKRPEPVATRDIDRLLEQGGDAPVYRSNLRASCHRLEIAGWLRTLRAPNLQLAVELTVSRREQAIPLLADVQARVRAEQRAREVVVLPVAQIRTDEPDTLAEDRLENVWYLACRADYVVRLDGTTCLQLWCVTGQVTRLAGDPRQVAQWLQACHEAGMAVRMQINESDTPEEGTLNGSSPADRTDSWYRQLDAGLQALGIHGLTDTMRLAVVTPEDGPRSPPAPAQQLHVLRESLAVFPPTAAVAEKDTEAVLSDLLARAGFTDDQAEELQLHRTFWPPMSEEDYARRELNLALRGLYCNCSGLTEIVFSPARNAHETWKARLKWLLSGELTAGFGFRSRVSRKEECALAWLAGYAGREVAESLATVIVWNEDDAGTQS